MVNANRSIIWDKHARNFLRDSIGYIRKDSPQNAELVKKAIISTIKQIPNHPYKYPADKFKQDNTGEYRAFELMRFRIAYYISDDKILILRIRHVSMEPKGY